VSPGAAAAALPSTGHEASVSAVLTYIATDALSSVGLVVSGLLVRWQGWTLADPIICLLIALLTLYNCVPLVKSMGLIILQTKPAGATLRSRIDRAMRELPSLEGVIECSQEHFWTHAPGVYVGTLVVRVQRHANEQAILANVHRIFSPFITHLTVQVEKDPDLDWLISPTAPATTPPSSAPAVPQATTAQHGHSHAHGSHGHSHAHGSHGHSHAQASHGHSHAQASHGHSHAHGSHEQCSHGSHGHSHSAPAPQSQSSV
jgi:hypothetical protein